MIKQSLSDTRGSLVRKAGSSAAQGAATQKGQEQTTANGHAKAKTSRKGVLLCFGFWGVFWEWEEGTGGSRPPAVFDALPEQRMSAHGVAPQGRRGEKY
jgi:hypothetical protein